MPTYFAFLRAVNLGSRRRFPKDDIRRVVEAAGFANVATYIHTGNVRFITSMRSRTRIEAALEAAFLTDRGFEVPTIVYSTSEFARISADATALATEHPNAERRYVDLLRSEPPAYAATRIEAASTDDIRLIVRGRAVHSLFGPGANLFGAAYPAIAELLGTATNRNAKVIAAITERWC